MARYDCERCGQECFTTEPEHVCKDILARLRRQEKQINAVVGILNEQMPHPHPNNEYRKEVALIIVSTLRKLGVEDD